METTKTICILANSIKRRGYCVAGITLEPGPDGTLQPTREWVRPISQRQGGAISEQESWLPLKNRIPKIFDVVEVPLQGRASVPGQPEDWLIQESASWHFRGRVSRDFAIQELLESPENLWLEPHQKNDRVTPAFVASHHLPSLYLIAPEEFRLMIDEAPSQTGPRKKRRAIFRYRGLTYDFAMTDPVIGEKYLPGFPDLPFGFQKRFPESVSAICVSLTPKFEGQLTSQAYHYKLVAAVIE